MTSTDDKQSPSVYGGKTYEFIKKTLPDDVVNAYAAKIQPFYLFHKEAVLYFEAFKSEGVRMTYDEWKQKPRVALTPTRHVLESPESVHNGYLYDQKPKVSPDDLDKKFEETVDGIEKMEFHGLHTYGGYYGFFRPDLAEVIHLIHGKVGDLSTVKRIYATTEAAGEGKVSIAYDAFRDRHRATTTVYIVRK